MNSKLLVILSALTIFGCDDDSAIALNQDDSVIAPSQEIVNLVEENKLINTR